MSKADNMLSILWLLKTGKQLTAKQLAEELEIHIRTVYRYIDALCASGVPIIADAGPGGGYKLLRPLDDAPLFFDLDEQKALVHAAQFAREAGYPYGDALERAVTKLKRYTNEEQREAIDRHASGLNVISPSPDRTVAEMLQSLEQSVADARTLRIDYRKERGAFAETRRIDPYGLIHWKSKWYVIGHCHLRGEVRSFRADRIQRIDSTEDAFVRPADFDARRFFLGSLLPDAEREEGTFTVRLIGHPAALADLCEHWQFGHGLLHHSDHEIASRIPAASLTTYLPYILLSYGSAIQVVEPPVLKERMISLASELSAHYRETD
ncbi:helix-turn-helix transcriptional regulator [Cohnella nanjingensis]|uniref:YafY family transcriptional regulator n=1 Tax=Cohnella nanjingensis TaxID=1387779 RepID=A0A7X0VIA9_9BACL|nr:YafY family protein [Cohnella nanjingensis]MBB6674333.1 YafY family transcriptional regulator [Cohnella nanjingensis]